MSLSPRRRALVAATLAAAALPVACSDPTAPGEAAGYYRLATVNGQPVPYRAPSSIGYTVVLSHGDLLLRPDGSFSVGMGEMGMGTLTDGRWSREGATIRLRTSPPEDGDPGAELRATTDGDSLVLVTGPTGWNAQPLHLVFRRAERGAPPVVSGGYAMTSLNGRADLVHEELDGGHRRVTRVLFDSIDFRDGLFFRRHRAERAVVHWSERDSSYGESAWVTHGSYSGSGGVLVLRDYRMAPGIPTADTLAVGQGTLTRRLAGRDPETGEALVWEELYTRHR